MNKQNQHRKALGRGLSNLIPTQVESSGTNEEIHLIDINAIRTNPFQPRTDFDEDEIQGLADSISNQGLLQPVVVRQKDNYYEIISGERRTRAFKLLKKDKVPCIIKNKVTDREMLELALVENIQREELNEIEKASAYQKLLLECNYTHDELSKQVGKSRTVITNSLRLLNLPDDVQQMVRKNQISMGHARALLALQDSKQMLDLANRIISENLSVRDIEKETQEFKGNKKIKVLPAEPLMDPDLANVVERLQYKFGTSVSIKQSTKEKGKLEFEYFNQQDLTRIVDILLA
ncbi:MAG: ParB/RepB/Spo0J family partition protein [Fibrobacter sp.]|nr:ParB/RepB/Spo0J family partition protein [Fibrobacter sp.]